jgi:hypothetical protein
VKIIAYHGTPFNFESFDYSTVGAGDDQEGPGFYFTTSRNDALKYALKSQSVPAPRILKVSLTLGKLVLDKGKTPRKQVEQLIDWAPDLEDTLTNWDEEPGLAKIKAINAMLAYSSPRLVFQSIWADFYRKDPAGYLSSMRALGYTGQKIVHKGFLSSGDKSVSHYTIYDRDAVEILEIEDLTQ